MTLSHAAQSGQHRHAERGADLYETPPCATEALLRVERLPHWTWEPAAGRGAIVNVLRDRGHAVIASDIVSDYGFPLHCVTNFLTTTTAPVGCRAIVSNPPYQIANEFTRHALKLVPAAFICCFASPSSNPSGAPMFSMDMGCARCMFSAAAFP